MKKLIIVLLAGVLALPARAQQPVPPPATPAEVAAGVNRFKYVTPYNLTQSGKVSTNIAYWGGLVRSNKPLGVVLSSTPVTLTNWSRTSEHTDGMLVSTNAGTITITNTGSYYVGVNVSFYTTSASAADYFGEIYNGSTPTGIRFHRDIGTGSANVSGSASASGPLLITTTNSVLSFRMSSTGTPTITNTEAQFFAITYGSGIADGSITTNKVDSVFYQLLTNTASGGVSSAEVAAIMTTNEAGGLAWRTITNVFGTSTPSVPVFASNVWLKGSGGSLVVTGLFLAPGLTLANTRLIDITVSNKVFDVAGSITVGMDGGSSNWYGPITFQDTKIYGDSYGVYFKTLESISSGSPIVAQDSIFRAREVAVDTWYSSGMWDRCTFETPSRIGTSTSGSTFSANDNSTNVLTDCLVIYSTNHPTITESVGLAIWRGADVTLNNCTFTNRHKSDTIASAVYNVEEEAYLSAYDCTFYLNGGMLLFAEQPPVGSPSLTNNAYLWSNCRIEPYTNGVVVYCDSATNYVIGGNLRPENFSHPSQVIFLEQGEARTKRTIVSEVAEIAGTLNLDASGLLVTDGSAITQINADGSAQFNNDAVQITTDPTLSVGAKIFLYGASGDITASGTITGNGGGLTNVTAQLASNVYSSGILHDTYDLARRSTYDIQSVHELSRLPGLFQNRNQVVWSSQMSVAKADYILAGTAYYDANIPAKTGLYTPAGSSINLYNAVPHGKGFLTVVAKVTLHNYNFAGGVTNVQLYSLVYPPLTAASYTTVLLTNTTPTDVFVKHVFKDDATPRHISVSLFGSTSGFPGVSNAVVMTSMECFGYSGDGYAETLYSGNGLALTPPMGWSEWNAYKGNYAEFEITNTATIMTNNGMLAAGYNIVLPDVKMWLSNRVGGLLVENTSVFPMGLTNLGNYLHDRGFKFGIYASATTNGGNSIFENAHCIGNERLDVQTFAGVGADYLKYDRFGGTPGNEISDRRAMAEALYDASRPIVYSVSMDGWDWYKSYFAHAIRIYQDSQPTWTYITNALSIGLRYADYCRPGSVPDLDMLEVGNGMTADEDTSHFALWCVMSSPLLASTQLTNPAVHVLPLLTNRSLISISQDPAVNGGYLVSSNSHGDGSTLVVAKRLSNGDVAAVLLNNTAATKTIGVSWTNLWMELGTRVVTNCLTQASLGGVTDYYSASIASHASAVIRVKGPSLAPEHLTEQPWTIKVGQVLKDHTIGGAPLVINEQWFPRNLRMGGDYSKVVYSVAQMNPKRFTAVIGLDDFRLNGTDGSLLIYGDRTLLFDSGALTASSQPQVNLSLAGIKTLTLVATNLAYSTNFIGVGRPILWK